MQEETRHRLIEAAGEAFGLHGYDAVGIREICQAAGANVAAVNYHFGDKRGLYVACLRRAQSCRIDYVANLPDADLPPEEKLRQFIRRILATTFDPSQPAWHLDVMLREMTRPTDACREIVEDYIRPMAEAIAELLKQLLPEATWNEQAWMVGFSIVGQILFYHFNQAIVRLLMGEDDFRQLSLDRLTDHITQFTLAAIGIRSPLGGDGNEAASTDTKGS